jgi:outer membrane autotransporter protein
MRRRGNGCALLALAAGLLGADVPAHGACLPASGQVTAGDAVSCSGENAAGYAVPEGIDEVSVVVEEGALFDSIGDGVRVNDQSAITNRGEIEVNGPGSAGIAGGDGDAAVYENAAGGTLSVHSPDAFGFRIGQQGRVTNAGQIDVLGTGSIGIATGNSAGVFQEGGLDVAGERGIGASVGRGAHFENSGELTVSGVEARGASGDIGATLVNQGTIRLQSANSLGFEGTANTSLNNIDEGRILIDASATGSVGISAGDNHGEVANLGELISEAAGSTAMRMGNDGDASGNLGTITSNGADSIGIEAGTNTFLINDVGALLEVSGARSTAIRAGADSSFSNFGEVRVGGLDSVGIHIDGSSDIDQSDEFRNFFNGPNSGGDGEGLLTSSDAESGPLVFIEASSNGAESRLNNAVGGRILADISRGDESGRGIAVQGSDGVDVVINAGLIRGKILLAGGDDRYETAAGAELEAVGAQPPLDGGAGRDEIWLVGESDESGSFDASRIQNFEMLRVESGTWRIVDQAEVLDREAVDLVLGRESTLSLDSPLSIGGDYSHASPSLVPQPGDPQPRVRALVSPATSAGPILQVTGSADLGDGDLEVAVGGGFQGSLDATLIRADGGIIREFDTITLPEDPDVQIENLAYGSDALSLTVIVAGYSEIQWSISQALVALSSAPSTDADFEAFLAELETLNIPDYKAAMDELSPEAYDAHATAVLNLGHQFIELLLEHPRYCEPASTRSGRDGSTAPPCRERHLDLWLSPYGRTGDREGAAGHTSYDDSAAGLVFGFDFPITSDLMLSAAIGSSHGEIDVAGVGRGHFNGFDLGLYAGYRRGPLQIAGIASYGHAWHQQTRSIEATSSLASVQGKYGGDRMGVHARAEYEYDAGLWLVTPRASVDYTLLTRSAFSESGNSSAQLSVDDEVDQVVTLRAGFEFSAILNKDQYWTDLLENLDGIWRPTLALDWRQIVAGEDRAIEARFSQAPGQAFRVQADGAGQGLEFSAGLDWTPRAANRLTFGLHYDGFLSRESAARSVEHDFMARMRFSF